MLKHRTPNKGAKAGDSATKGIMVANKHVQKLYHVITVNHKRLCQITVALHAPNACIKRAKKRNISILGANEQAIEARLNGTMPPTSTLIRPMRSIADHTRLGLMPHTE